MFCAGVSAHDVADAAAMRHCKYMFPNVVLDVLLLLVSAWMKVRYSELTVAKPVKHTS